MEEQQAQQQPTSNNHNHHNDNKKKFASRQQSLSNYNNVTFSSLFRPLVFLNLILLVVDMSSGSGRFQFSRNRGNSKGGGNSHSNSNGDLKSPVEIKSGGRWSKLNADDSEFNNSGSGRRRDWSGTSSSSQGQTPRGGAQRGQDSAPQQPPSRPSALSTLQWKKGSGDGSGSAGKNWSRPPTPSTSSSSNSNPVSSGSGYGGGHTTIAGDKRELLSIIDGFYNAVLEGEKEDARGEAGHDHAPEDLSNDHDRDRDNEDHDDDDSSTGSSSIGSVYGFGSQSYRSYRHRTEHTHQQDRGTDRARGGSHAAAVCPALFLRLSTGAAQLAATTPVIPS